MARTKRTQTTKTKIGIPDTLGNPPPPPLIIKLIILKML